MNCAVFLYGFNGRIDTYLHVPQPEIVRRERPSAFLITADNTARADSGAGNELNIALTYGSAISSTSLITPHYIISFPSTLDLPSSLLSDFYLINKYYTKCRTRTLMKTAIRTIIAIPLVVMVTPTRSSTARGPTSTGSSPSMKSGTGMTGGSPLALEGVYYCTKTSEMKLIVANSPVGSGKTALMLALSRALRDEYSIAAVTNDIFTRWDSFIPTR